MAAFSIMDDFHRQQAKKYGNGYDYLPKEDRKIFSRYARRIWKMQILVRLKQRMFERE